MKMICIPKGCTMPAAAPCMTRPEMSTPSSGAKPDSKEPKMNISIAAAKVRRKPKRSTSQPFNNMVPVTEARKAVETNCA